MESNERKPDTVDENNDLGRFDPRAERLRCEVDAIHSSADVVLNIDVDTLVNQTVALSERTSGSQWSADDIASLREEYVAELREYQEMELDLPITDQPMRRICQVLTNEGFITTDSCDGHGGSMPSIFFYCNDDQKLRELAHVLARASHIKNFPWHAEIWSGDPGLNQNSPLFYVLCPSAHKASIDCGRDYRKLLQDLDTIGFCIKQHFDWIREE
jgi:hypothetical protein